MENNHIACFRFCYERCQIQCTQ